MNVQTIIEDKLRQSMTVHHLEVVDESDNHNVPPGSQSHFKVVVVADDFDGKSLIARHQLVYGTLSEEMSRIHALALHTYSPKDWPNCEQAVQRSPQCHGGSKAG